MIGSLFALALLSPRQPPARDARVASMSTASTTARPAVPPSAPPRELDSNHLHLLQATLDSSGGKAAVQRAACAAIVRVFGCSPGDGGGETGRGDGAGGGGAAPGDGEVASRETAVLPSGAGKTVLALRVAEALASSLTVVLIPARDLVSQSHRDWERWRSAPGPLDGLRSLAVCSSTSVPRAVLPRSTDTDAIATFLRETEGAPRVIFCTYHSADRVGAALREVGAAADLLVCDEAHRCTGRTSKRFARPLFDEFLPARRRLFLTATPKLIGEKRDADGALIPAGSMDDESLFGRQVYRLSYGEAVRLGVVSPLKLVFLDVADRYAAWAAGRVSDSDTDDSDLVALCLAMLDCRRSYGVRTAFAFSSSNARAARLELVATSVLESDEFAVGRVNGSMLSDARERRLAPLRRAGEAAAPTQLVTNCRVLAEGVDLPSVDLVVFADAKQSHVDILQCMGRASRVAPGKAFGYILVPVSEEAADGGAHGRATAVLRAYAEQDAEFREALAALVSGEARAGGPLDYSEWPEALRSVLLLPDRGDVQRAAERTVATVARELIDRWERMFGLLQAFREQEGHANVPRKHVEDGEQLGGWLSRQRKLHKQGLLPGMRAQRLEAVGVVWDARAEQWERMFGLLQAFREREAHANVPDRYVEDGEKLGSWLQTQRKRYKARGWSEAERKRGKASAMSDEEVERMEALGVAWDPLAEQWERMFALLQAFKQREGHTNVPAKHVEDGEKLGVWLSDQRKRYKARGLSEAECKRLSVSAMSDGAVERLEAVGVVWDARAEQLERMFGLLQAFREREGHTNVPYRHVEDGEKLGVCLSNQRKRYQARGWSEAERKCKKASAMSDEVVERLEALGVAWDVLAEQWERMFGLLQAFREREGHANVPYRHVEDGEKLGVWLGTQRKRYQARGLSEAERKRRYASALSDEEVERLEALGVVWDVLAEQWERMFGLLQAFREREGHANVPSGHVEDGEKLGSWLSTQRKRYQARGWSEAERKGRKTSAMSDGEVERLEVVGVVWQRRGTPT